LNSQTLNGTFSGQKHTFKRTTRADGKSKTTFPSRSRLAIKSTLDFIKSLKASLLVVKVL
jgi:hypothetical protein